MKLQDLCKQKRPMLDGAMGTQLQAAGLPIGVLPEEWNLTHPDAVTAIHRAYLRAGSDIIYANTFGANSLKLGARTEEIVKAGIGCAKKAAADFSDRLVALDIGPTGRLLKPLGDLDFEDAVSIFKTTVCAGVEAGADLIVIETMNDTYELKAAMLAAKESCSLPIIVTGVFDRSGKMMTGASVEAMVALCEGLGASAVGLNCSLGPEQMLPVVERMLKAASIPVVVKPNAGLPCEENGKTYFTVSAEEFAAWGTRFLELGVCAIGGCCGTNPTYIEKLTEIARSSSPVLPIQKQQTVIASYTHTVQFGGVPILIGERINPTGKKRLKQALIEGDTAYVLGEALAQADAGAHVLDVNVGLPEIDEAAVLADLVCELQAVTDLPLQLDTSDPVAMEAAMRRYNGKPLINSVSGKQAVMDRIFPLVKHYGGVVVALTLDENGIPDTAEGRVQIAKHILQEAEKYGLSKKDLIFDPLAMAVSADSRSPRITLDALDMIRHQMEAQTSLGVSNISFGLPNRDLINGSFFAMALERGLSAAILNPHAAEMQKAYHCFCALNGYDENCLEYINYASTVTATPTATVQPTAIPTKEVRSLREAIERGLRKDAQDAAARLLQTEEPMQVIQGQIIPALDAVGKLFESKKLFLPQLLMSAEASSAAFEVIKASFGASSQVKRLKLVIATVQGDIHDIGKNIVKTLLENYGFSVVDLGKDVPPSSIVETATKIGADVVGLSALMTTTVPAMEETIARLQQEYPSCRTLVGGAVLTADYAKRIGATHYAKDAMESVRYCEELEAELYGPL